jgi:hypothetical protein
MFDVPAYRSQKNYFPRLADQIDTHQRLNPECSCEFWTPPLETSPFGTKTLTCCNCQITVQNTSGIRESDFQKELYVYEYTAAVLNTNADTQSLDLCSCCYDDFKKEFELEFLSVKDTPVDNTIDNSKNTQENTIEKDSLEPIYV